MVVGFLPIRFVESHFAFWGFLAFYIVAKERKRTLNSLSIAYGGTKTPKEIKRMGREVFVNQALNFADYTHALKWKLLRRAKAAG